MTEAEKLKLLCEQKQAAAEKAAQTAEKPPQKPDAFLSGLTGKGEPENAPATDPADPFLKGFTGEG